MNFNLRMTNCWIGLCKGVDPLPKNLIDLGYLDRGIERPFKTATHAECKPELMIASRTEKHATVWEWKSGRSIDLDQLLRYATVTRDDLVERAFLPAVECETHDCILLVQEEHVSNTVALLKREGVDFPVVGAFPNRFKTVHSEVKGQKLGALLKDFPCDWEHAPVSFVPLDRDSSVEEVAPHVVTLLLQRMLRQDTMIASIDLCGDVCPLFSSMGPEAQQDVQKKISDVFAAAAKHEFSPYVEYRVRGGIASELSVIRNPFQTGEDKRSRSFKRMKRLQVEFVEQLAQGHRPRPLPGLFDLLVDPNA